MHDAWRVVTVVCRVGDADFAFPRSVLGDKFFQRRSASAARMNENGANTALCAEAGTSFFHAIVSNYCMGTDQVIPPATKVGLSSSIGWDDK